MLQPHSKASNALVDEIAGLTLVHNRTRARSGNHLDADQTSSMQLETGIMQVYSKIKL